MTFALKEIDVSFVVPSSRTEHLVSCLSSIFAQKTTLGFEVICVLNGLGPETEEQKRILGKHFPALTLIETEKRGAGHARNVGARQARGDLLAFVDSDVVLEADWLEILAPELSGYFDCAAGAIVPASRRQSLLDRFRYNWKDLATSGSFVGSVQSLHLAIPVVNTAACIYRRSLFERLGGFDVSLKREEDTDLSRRAFLAGCHFSMTDAAVAHVYFHGSLLQYWERFFLNRFHTGFRPPQRWKSLKEAKVLDKFSWPEKAMLIGVQIAEWLGFAANKIFNGGRRAPVDERGAVPFPKNLAIRKNFSHRQFVLQPTCRLLKLKTKGQQTFYAFTKYAGTITADQRDWETLSSELIDKGAFIEMRFVQ